MPEPILVRTLEQVVAIHLHDEAEELEQDVRRAWSRCLAPDATDAGRIDVVVREHTRPRRTSTTVEASSPQAAMELLTQAVTLAGLEHGAGRLLMLHACGLVEPVSGRAVVLAAPSGTGKSTAARHLGVRWGYLSDETVALREDGTLVPYPKPLSLREEGRWKTQVSPDDLGLLAATEGPELVSVVILDRREDVTPEVVPLSLSEAVARLAEHTSYLPALPRPLHRLAQAAPAGVAVLRYASTAELEGRLLPLVGAAA